jgi:hypothetical protein
MFCLNNREVQTNIYCIIVMTLGWNESLVLFNFTKLQYGFNKKKFKVWENFSSQMILQAVLFKPLTVTKIPYIYLTSTTFVHFMHHLVGDSKMKCMEVHSVCKRVLTSSVCYGIKAKFLQ